MRCGMCLPVGQEPVVSPLTFDEQRLVAVGLRNPSLGTWTRFFLFLLSSFAQLPCILAGWRSAVQIRDPA